MRKRFALLILILTLTLPLAAFAAGSTKSDFKEGRGYHKIDFSKLSEQQKVDMLSSWKKIMEAKKDAVRKMVENKTITKDQGDKWIKAMDAKIEFRQKNGFKNEFGKRKGKGKRPCKMMDDNNNKIPVENTTR